MALRVTEVEPVEGEGLLLRGWTNADAEQVAVLATDPLIQQWNPMGPRTAQEWVASRADWSDGDHASWAVVDPAAPDLVLGSVSVFDVDHDQSGAEVGFWVTPSARGQRIATRALRLATGFVFDRLELRRVILYHAVDNPGSCGVATAAGYALEGTHRESYRYGDGVWHDEHSHARLTTD